MPDVLDGGREPAGIAGHERDARAARDRESRGREPDATRSAGDHHVRVSQVRHPTIVPRNPGLASHCVPRAQFQPHCCVGRGAGRRDAHARRARRRGGRRRRHLRGAAERQPGRGDRRRSGASAVLRTGDGTTVATRKVDRAGQHALPPGRRGRRATGSRSARCAPPEVTVVDPGRHAAVVALHRPGLDLGYGYLKTRDGTSLSVNVKLPGPAEEGPYPTVVEYSGYDPSNPDGQQPASRIAQLLGFATVGVNLRGTGCSGGAFDYFETLQSLDGYDVIETVAAQPWVAHGKVGMVGISYPGITQLFVAGTRPPHLAAITPLSVLDDTYDTLYPGGIFNNGFALGWAEDRTGRRPPGGRSAAAGSSGPQSRIAERRHHLSREPGAAVAGRRHRRRDPGQPVPARRGHRGTGPGELAVADRRPGVPRRHLAGPGDRQPLRQHARRVLGRHPGEDHADERAAPGHDRSGCVRAVGRVPRLLRRAGGSPSCRRCCASSRRLRSTPVRRRRVIPARSLHRAARLRHGPARVRGRTAGARALRSRQRCDHRFRRSAPTAPAWPLPATTATTWYFGPDGALSDAPPASTSVARTASTTTPRRSRGPAPPATTSRRQRRRRRRRRGRAHSRSTGGSRCPTARRSPT